MEGTKPSKRELHEGNTNRMKDVVAGLKYNKLRAQLKYQYLCLTIIWFLGAIPETIFLSAWKLRQEIILNIICANSFIQLPFVCKH